MRVLLGLAIAVAVTSAIAGCSGTEDVVLSESPTGTTPAASPLTPTVAATATPSPVGSVSPSLTHSTTTEALEYSDSDYEVALRYPRGWTVSIVPVTPDQAELDVLKRVEFIAKDGLPRVRLFIAANPDDLSLREWLENRNPIFLDTPPQEVTVNEVSGLYQPLSLGLPMPQAYFGSGSIIVSIAALSDEDYETVIDTLVIG